MFVLVLASTAAGAYTANPVAPRCGDVIHVSGEAVAVRMNGRTVPLFAGSGPARVGLMPVPLEEKPGKYPLEFLGTDGRVAGAVEITVREPHYPKQNIVIGKEKKELRPSPGETETVRAFRETVSATRYWEEPLVLPVRGCMTSPFGVARLHNGQPTGSYHRGIDQRGATGTPVRATAAGIVKIARMFNLHGGTIGIDHGQGLTSMYLHLSRLAAEEGARVEKGAVVGYVGTTGFSTAPHLHWALYAHGVSVSPLQWVQLKPCAAPVRAKKKKR
ncbi:MAG: M23 family metallopeptidase [Bryobacteraceae bacterium]|nr:M23 family metallopeptidase [Bryobacterales bacterium]MEB2362473.1 M23 family metallopeptidase [Bryobacterales bacterium]NUN03586.1 M23 family metallopeptidase [Bryobacteraceae bacterium]